MAYRALRVLVLIATLSLIACGGGGDDAPVAAAPPADPAQVVVPVNQVFERAFATNRGVAMRPQGATDDRVQLVLSTTVPTSLVAFNGGMYRAPRITLEVRANGAAGASDFLEIMLNGAVFHAFGMRGRAGEHTVFSPSVSGPASALPGQSGEMFDAIEYTDATRSVRKGRWIGRWATSVGDSVTAWACLQMTYVPANTQIPTTTSYCFRANAQAEIVQTRVQATVAGSSGVTTFIQPL